jgi:hypothetical protein
MAPTTIQIAEAFKAFDCDKGFLHGYEQMYGFLFEKTGTPATLLEIGFRRGKSAAAWAQLFPVTELTFVEMQPRDDVIPEALGMNVIVANSTLRTIAQKVGKTFDVIIDDGDHRPDSQWQTFTRLVDNWKKAYVIEDVVGTENMQLLRRRLVAAGYRDIHTFTSKLKDGIVRVQGEDVPQTFYSIVVFPKPNA